MLVLALDTALSAATAAVADGGRLLAVASQPMARGHQEAIALLTRDVMTEAGVPFSDLARIGVTVGPGSFTGLRVGLAFAKGLALAWNIPLVGLGTLEALAESATGARVLAAVDAGRGQIYLQPHQGEPLQLPVAEAVELARRAAPDVIVGSACPLLAKAAPSARLLPLDYPSADALVRLTNESPAPSAAPKPMYLRAPDARTLAERGIVR